MRKRFFQGKRLGMTAMAFLLSAGMTFSACTDARELETTKESSTEPSREQVPTPTEDVDVDDHLILIVTHDSDRKMIKTDYSKGKLNYEPSVPAYSVKADLSNVANANRFYLLDGEKKALAEYDFCVYETQYNEFFEIYESNRYEQYPSFITTDSIMHTYHLYFAMLQENTEREYLIGHIENLTTNMLKIAAAHYDRLKGTEWEMAAERNLKFFSVASELLGLNNEVPAVVSNDVRAEVQKIMNAKTMENSIITGEYEDYTQYKPRGYYEGDEKLEKYFRAMSWYGRINFSQQNFSGAQNDVLNQCALLMTLAMDNDVCYADWDRVYEVTSFFVGQSDDLGYYDYLPAIKLAYGNGFGGNHDVKELVGDTDGWNAYVDAIQKLRAPEINSLIFPDDNGETDKTEAGKGFRFMGQRFTMDAAVFTQLCYGKVKEAPDGDKRMLPDALDVPAAMGSELALELLKEQGVEKYPNYLENMEKVRKKIAEADEYWSSSLYGGWMYTLAPLLQEKGEGYPSFMTNKEWQKKSLEGYLGSWTELKHDTILYAKQMIAEMGGGDWETYDDRGYVEPEPELYARLYALTVTTSEGLSRLGVIREVDKEGIERLGELAATLQEISVKELKNEGLTDEEYDFIREYGGALEHLWDDTVKSKKDSEWIDSSEFPMALVTDVATNPNGVCLQEAIGGASRIYVVFPIDGELHIGIGGVFNYYQFVQPTSDRLTDSEWRIMLGMQLDENDEYHPQRGIKGPDWVQSYRFKWEYEY